MRKIAGILIFILTVLLCACSPIIKADYPVNSLASSIDGAIEIGTDFHMITSPDITNYGSGNEQGFYSIFSNKDGSRNLMYIDYDSLNQIYLCYQPNCEHNSEKCNAWIAPFDGTVVPAVTEKQLFLIYSSYTQKAKVEQMDLSGDNKKTIFTFPNAILIENAIAGNDHFWVFSVSEYAEVNHEVQKMSYLMALDLQTYRQFPLFVLNEQLNTNDIESASLFFKGVTPSGFVVEAAVQYKYQIEESDVDKSFENMNRSMIHTIYNIPFDGSEPQKCLSYSNLQCEGMPYGDYFFYVKQKDNGMLSLNRFKFSTGQSELLEDDFAKDLLNVSLDQLGTGDVVFRNFFDGYLLVNVLTNSYIAENGNIELEFTGVSIEQNTGKMQIIDLSNYYNATKVPVDIIAQNSKKLLVFASISPLEGSMGELGLLERKVGLINKADYLNSAPNFEMIDMIRAYS